MGNVDKILEEMLIPNKNEYWDRIVFGAELYENDKRLILYLYTTKFECDTKYLKSHSRMNVSKLRKTVKEVLNLNNPIIEMKKIQIDTYLNRTYRLASLSYRINQELVDKLIALKAIKASELRIEKCGTPRF